MEHLRTLLTTGAVVAVAGAGLVTSTSTAASADPAQVVSGTFAALPGAAGSAPDVAGTVHLVRTAAGTTRLSVHVSGLRPGVTYGSHLHGAPCSANAAGGHYKHDPLGASTPPNELWASSVAGSPTAGLTANAAGRASGRGTVDWTAGETARAVVVHIGSDQGGTTAGGTKIACADLG